MPHTISDPDPRMCKQQKQVVIPPPRVTKRNATILPSDLSPLKKIRESTHRHVDDSDDSLDPLDILSASPPRSRTRASSSPLTPLSVSSRSSSIKGKRSVYHEVSSSEDEEETELESESEESDVPVLRTKKKAAKKQPAAKLPAAKPKKPITKKDIKGKGKAVAPPSSSAQAKSKSGGRLKSSGSSQVLLPLTSSLAAAPMETDAERSREWNLNRMDDYVWCHVEGKECSFWWPSRVRSHFLPDLNAG